MRKLLTGGHVMTLVPHVSNAEYKVRVTDKEGVSVTKNTFVCIATYIHHFSSAGHVFLQ